MIRKEPYTYTEETTRYHYYTSDEREFSVESNARRHEAEITPLRKIKTKMVFLNMEGINSTAYYITSQEDIDYLKTINYWDEWDDSLYTKPGWYICFIEIGGDNPDICRLVPAEAYIKELEDSIVEIQKLYI